MSLAARVTNQAQNYKVVVMPGGPYCKTEDETIDPSGKGARQELWSTLEDIQNLDFGDDICQITPHQVLTAVPSEKKGIERTGKFQDNELFGPDVTDFFLKSCHCDFLVTSGRSNKYFHNHKGFGLCSSPVSLERYEGMVLRMSTKEKFQLHSFKGEEDPLSFRWKHRDTHRCYDYSE